MSSREQNRVFSPVFVALVTSICTRGVQSLGGVIINAAIARHLNTDEFGSYFIILSVASLLSTFILFGSNTVILRVSASNGSVVAFKEMFKMSLSMLITACIVYLVYFSDVGYSLLSYFGLNVVSDLQYIVAGLAAVVAMQSLMHDYYRGGGRLTFAAAVANNGALGSIGYGFVSNILFCCGLSLLLLFGIKLNLYQILCSGTIIGALIVCFAWTTEKIKVSRFASEVGEVFSKRRRSMERGALLLTALLAIVLNQMDIYTVSLYFSKTEVGLYGAAQRLSLIVLLPLMIITAFFQPISARLFSTGDMKTLSGISRAFTSVLLALGIAALIIFMIAGKQLMSFVYGPAFMVGAGILVLKAAGSVALLGTGLANAVFTTTGNERFLVIVGFLGVCLFSGFTMVWTPSSIEQVAALHSTVIAIMSSLYAYYSRRHISVDISPCLRPREIWKVLQGTFSGRGMNISVGSN